MFAPTGAAVGRGYAAGGFIGGGDGEVMAMFQTSDVAERYLVRPGAERPIAAAAAEPWWAGAFESAAMGHDASSIEAQLVALQQVGMSCGYVWSFFISSCLLITALLWWLPGDRLLWIQVATCRSVVAESNESLRELLIRAATKSTG